MSGGGVMLSGWLRKSPPEKKMKRPHSWKKRWFILKSGRLSGDPNVLEYYKHQASRKPIKVINLNDCAQIDINVPIRPDKKGPAHQFVFDIITNSRTFFLVADSLREMTSWVRCLCDLCGFNNDARADSNSKGDFGTSFQTFKADPLNRNVNGDSSATATLLSSKHGDVDVVRIPEPLPRPDAHLVSASKHAVSVDANSSVGVKTVTHENGYDFPQEDSAFDESFSGFSNTISDRNPVISRQPYEGLCPPKVDITNDNPDSNGYLHLANCETVTESSGLLDVGKMDDRRSSTDSVFTHEGGDDTIDDAMNPPPVMYHSMHSKVPQNSRFLQLSKEGGRLSSMPDCPPPPPPINVPPLRLTNYNDDEEDEVTDARRNPHSKMHKGAGSLAPIGDSDLYKVPLNLQREHHVDEDGTPWSGNSTSSYGSAIAGGHFSSKSMLSCPEYINTSENKSSGSFSGGSLGMFPSPGLLHDATHAGGRVLYDTPSPLSPIFPLNDFPNVDYQLPRVQMTKYSTCGSDSAASEPEHARSDVYVKKQLDGIPMLDVGGATSPMGSAPHTASTPPNPAAGQSLYSTPREYQRGFSPDDSRTPESLYSSPPARPPKPLAASNQPSDVDAKTVIHINVSKAQESMYMSPRAHSSSSTGSYNNPHSDNATYDTVRQPSPLSPPHATVEVNLVDSGERQSKRFPFGGAAKQRNAISAANSPLTTPNLGRKIDKTNSFSSTISAPMQKSKLLSGSAPSVYDVPQPLRPHALAASPDSPGRPAPAEVDGSHDVNKVSASSIYDTPKRFEKVDDDIQSYEKMAAQQAGVSDAEDTSIYTAMAGATTAPFSAGILLQQAPQTQAPLSRPVDTVGSQDVPPPVHRDLKPGRRSLGSDGGLSQAGSERRKDNLKDGYDSDEAVSPPHTTIIRTLPAVNEPKFYSGYSSSSFSPMPSPAGSRSNSITSPQHGRSERSDSFGDRLSVSPVPPQRPPKYGSHSGMPPKPPSMSQKINQLSSKSFSSSRPTPHDRRFAKAQTDEGAPQRPPKPANMKMHQDMPNAQGWNEEFSPPRRPHKSSDGPGAVPSRPPKPSTTPSSGDSLFSDAGLHSGSFFPSSVVPPAPMDQQVERELRYIELRDFPTPGENALRPAPLDRPAGDEPVEYIQIDVGRTKALEKMKAERQTKLQERANFDLSAFAKGKDRHK